MLLIMVFLPMVSAVLAALCGRNGGGAGDNTPDVGHKKAFAAPGTAYWVALLSSAAELVLSVMLFLLPASEIRIPMVLSYGLYLTLSGFRKIYALIISFMWFMTLMLSREYFSGHHHLIRYYFFNLMTEGAILGVFFAGDLFTALVFFEVMSFTSFVWVIQEETEGAIRAANTYLAIAVIGGLAALMGIFLLQHAFGTTDIARLSECAEACGNKKLLYAAGACILVGFGAKAGMFPLHIWLPKAHPVAPAPASALLSGVLTKSGIFGVIAISCGLFREDPNWGFVILILGTITMFLGALLALLSVDLKRTLACSSMSQIGFTLLGIACTCLLGEEGILSAAGTMLHMVNHSLLKLVLFISAGIVYMNLHELSLNRIRGFGRGKRVLQICFLLGAVGIGGIPGFNGYISKTLLHEGIVEASHLYGWGLKLVEWVFLLSGGMTLAYMTKLYVCIFVEKPDTETQAFQEEMHAHHPKYLGVFGHIAVIGAAVLMPVLGLTGNSLMQKTAHLAAPFFRAEEIGKMSYFSLENLKGAGISLLFGAAIYFLIVRKCLMKNGEYVNVLPAKLDLEDSVYRPLLLKVLPGIFGPIAAVFGENKVLKPLCGLVLNAAGKLSQLFGENRVTAPLWKGSVRFTGILSRAASDTVDAFVYFLSRSALRPVYPPPTDEEKSSVSYRLGNTVDRIQKRRGKEAESGHHFAELFYRLRRTLVRKTHNLADTMSFPLFMMILALTAVLLYVLFVHHFG